MLKPFQKKWTENEMILMCGWEFEKKNAYVFNWSVIIYVSLRYTTRFSIFCINSVWLRCNWCQMTLFPNSLTTFHLVQFALTFFLAVVKDDLWKEHILKYAGGFAQTYHNISICIVGIQRDLLSGATRRHNLVSFARLLPLSVDNMNVWVVILMKAYKIY